MIIGSFEYNAKTDIYFGEVTFCDRKIHLKPLAKRDANDPDYWVGTSADFGVFEFGAAWKRKGPGGRHILSVAIDSPLFPAPISATLYPAEGTPFAELVWERTGST